MIDWIDSLLKDYADELHRPVSGWQRRSLGGRLIEEGPVGGAVQRHAGVILVAPMSDRGKMTRDAIKVLAEELQVTVWVFYYPKASRKAKTKVLGISKSEMYRRLDRAHEVLLHEFTKFFSYPLLSGKKCVTNV